MKTLIYYFYVHPTGWNDLYDFHIYNLKAYKEVFDKQIFIISHDPDTLTIHIDNVRKAIHSVFPDAEIRNYANDKDLRESKWFYNEIATKLSQLPDQWYFFAHNKGVDTWYTPVDNCKRWIMGMYFMNLNYMDKIEEQMDQYETCVIGTYLIRNVKAWPWLRYN